MTKEVAPPEQLQRPQRAQQETEPLQSTETARSETAQQCRHGPWRRDVGTVGTFVQQHVSQGKEHIM